MHLLTPETHALFEIQPAVDLAQSPGDIVFLSYSDSDLSALAKAWSDVPAQGKTLRLANIKRLEHPYSVDLYVEKTIAGSRFVLIRMLGGLDYWRYGIDEIAAACRARKITLAVVPGDHVADARLDAASTLPASDIARIWRGFQQGDVRNLKAVLEFAVNHLDGAVQALEPSQLEPSQLAPFGVIAAACRTPAAQAAQALIVCYRSHVLADDIAPVTALAGALTERGLGVSSVFVTSLKDPQAAAALRTHIGQTKPDIILNATAFAARFDAAASVLEAADAPVLQVILANAGADAWRQSRRGLGPADLAMHIVLPEVDGRIITRAVSFKAPLPHDEDTQCARLAHAPETSRVNFVADLAANWARLRKTPRGARKLALVMSDYPAKGGRAGYAIGLDTPASVRAIVRDLADAGFGCTLLDEVDDTALMLRLTGDIGAAMLIADYKQYFDALPYSFKQTVTAAWGAAEGDPTLDAQGRFLFRLMQSANVTIALQPDRAGGAARSASYHDANLPPRHSYIAFYLWLRHVARIDAMVHCGAHGTLEWLPGKSVALDADCAPEILTGALPVIYPFIVNNPGEAAQARRRLCAVTLGHLPPPLTEAGVHGAAAEIEALLDEYSSAAGVDPPRARRLAQTIVSRASETGLLEDINVRTASADDTLSALDAWICDIKEMRVGDGLHVYGRSTSTKEEAGDTGLHSLLRGCARAESAALIAALDGRFVEPGPSGAPSATRLDVLPTGRNLYAADPRALPTRAACALACESAGALLARHAQDHGEWPKSVVIDLWGSAAMRTGGHDFAKAFALMGLRPTWDNSSTRVSGFEIVPLAVLGRPRVDVTLRISGLFRDSFPMQLDLFAAAVRALAALDELAEDNPLAANTSEHLRIFGAAPGAYGLGLTRVIAEGGWAMREELGEAYLAANSHSYAGSDAASPAAAAFRARVAAADAYVLSEDLEGQDMLGADAVGEHAGGFAAAAQSLGRKPAVYLTDLRSGGAARVRSLAENIARVTRGRAANPRWLAGQMRHGWRGAAEIAETVDNFFALATLADAVTQHQFDLLCDAVCGDAEVRQFLIAANPAAARAIAARFEEAIGRGLWHTRRNSTAAVLAEMRDACA